MADLGINTLISVFKKNILNVINNSNLPISVVYYVTKDIFRDVEQIYNETLKKELEEFQKEDVQEHQE